MLLSSWTLGITNASLLAISSTSSRHVISTFTITQFLQFLIPPKIGWKILINIFIRSFWLLMAPFLKSASLPASNSSVNRFSRILTIFSLFLFSVKTDKVFAQSVSSSYPWRWIIVMLLSFRWAWISFIVSTVIASPCGPCPTTPIEPPMPLPMTSRIIIINIPWIICAVQSLFLIIVLLTLLLMLLVISLPGIDTWFSISLLLLLSSSSNPFFFVRFIFA